VDCKLESVEIEAFGAFLGPVKYPLTDRGVRIVSGKNLDSMGADSNGAGKSTLVMAPLWALTGSTDVRPDSVRGLTASEVVHHSAKQARVRVDGTINGISFTVERRAGRSVKK
jgi:DNA repair exonuclease SbcCD ATPase subunit